MTTAGWIGLIVVGSISLSIAIAWAISQFSELDDDGEDSGV